MKVFYKISCSITYIELRNIHIIMLNNLKIGYIVTVQGEKYGKFYEVIAYAYPI